MAEDLPENLPVPASAPALSEPPEDLASLLREHPGLIVAGGLAIGLLAGVMLPKRTAAKAGGNLGTKALSIAAVAAELAVTLGQQAREQAGDAASEGRAKLADLGESAGTLGRKAAHRASAVKGEAARTGLKLARQAVKLAAKARKA